MKDLIFVGGIFTQAQRELILRSSKGSIQNAADALQQNLLKGLTISFGHHLKIVNLPFVGSFPLRSRLILFPGSDVTNIGGANVYTFGFINLTIIKYFARGIRLLFGLIKLTSTKGRKIIYIYSFHLPFIVPAIVIKLLRGSDVNICLMVPDLPEHMEDRRKSVHYFFKRIEWYIGKQVLRFIDKYVVLTDAIAEKLRISKNNYLVIEGIADDEIKINPAHQSAKKYIFYSGTLAQRYGVRQLVDTFMKIHSQDAELWICGEGDCKEYINEIAKDNKKIKFLGQLERKRVIELQQSAYILINPRRPEGEFTKYSFPSKVIEYMTSGRPVIMFKLPGIPQIYYNYCYTPELCDSNGLAKCIDYVMTLPELELDEMGKMARNFILREKTYKVQAEKIKEFLLGETNV